MPSASSCFLHVFGFRKIEQEKFLEKIEKITENYFATKEARSQEAMPVGHPGPLRRPRARPWAYPRQGVAQAPQGTSGTDLLPYLFFRLKIARSATLFPELDPEAPPPPKP